MTRRIYIAGPEIFLPDWAALGEAKKDLCRKYGYEGLYPMDPPVDHSLPPRALGVAVFHSDERLMEMADFAIANITPFRGVSCDVGTAVEIGWFRAARKPVLAYTNTAAALTERVRAVNNGTLITRPDGALADSEGLMIEGFEMMDNPMVEVPVLVAGFEIVVTDVPHAERFRDLRGFERCLQMAASAGL